MFQVCSICCLIFLTYQEPHKRVSGLFRMLFYISNLSRATQACFRFVSYVVLYFKPIKSHTRVFQVCSVCCLYFKPIKSHTNVFQVCSICCFILQTYQEPHKRVSGLILVIHFKAKYEDHCTSLLNKTCSFIYNDYISLSLFSIPISTVVNEYMQCVQYIQSVQYLQSMSV